MFEQAPGTPGEASSVHVTVRVLIFVDRAFVDVLTKFHRALRLRR